MIRRKADGAGNDDRDDNCEDDDWLGGWSLPIHRQFISYDSMDG